jgi:hypothetical protein
MVVTFGPMRPGPSCLRGHRGRIHGYHADVPAANRRRPAFIYVLPRHRQSNTRDKLRASNTLNARQLHPFVRRRVALDGLVLHGWIRRCAWSVHDFPLPEKGNVPLLRLMTADCSGACFTWLDK